MIAIFYDILLFLPAAIAGSLLAKPHFADDISAALYVTVIIVSFIFLLLMKHFKLRDRLILAGAMATLIAAFVFAQDEGTRLEWLKDHTWVLWAALTASLITLILMFARQNRITRVIPAVAALLFLPVSLFWGNTPDKACVLLIFLFSVITFADEFQHRHRKEGDPCAEKHLVFISPFILAVFIAAAFIPVSSKPYGWGFVHKIYDNVQKGLSAANRLISDVGWDSKSPFIGFSDNGRFGGNLTGGGYTVLDLTSSAINDPYLYLAGRTYETFDGRRWSGSDSSEVSYFDAIETASAALDCLADPTPVYNEPLLDYIRPVTLETNKNSTGSERTFSPAKTFDTGGNKVSYLRINTSAPAFSDLLNEGHTVTDESWNTARELIGAAGDGYDLSQYKKYRDDLKKTYLPETIVSDSVRKYMDDVIEGASTDYEKLTRIEEMLRGGRYTDTPGDLPETLDSPRAYLDYFLFEKQEGYCSYYATAFVLLARSCGIPARLVQGYKVPAGNKLHITVSSTDAHAWAEGYIDGIGWITFEPTPGMASGSASSGWLTAEEAAEYYRAHYSTQNTENTDDQAEAADDDPAPDTSVPLSRIMIPILCGLIFTALLLVLDMLLKRRRYLRSSDREKALWLCRRIVHILSRHGYIREGSETLSEYRTRLLAAEFTEDLSFLNIYENLLYSTRDVTNEEVVSLEKTYNELKRSMRYFRLS